MIINKEQIDFVDENGAQRKMLIISYVNKDGEISFMKWPIPLTEMYEWAYTTRHYADPEFTVQNSETGEWETKRWMSYDNKFIKKVPCGKKLSDYRINEILLKFGDAVKDLFLAVPPKTWYCDIETEVSEEGFPDAETAMQAINTIAITRFPGTIVFGRKYLSDLEIKQIQHKLDTYSDLIKNYKFEYRYFPTEREMLEAFIDYIQDKPCITGWNFLNFDWKYIFNRCKNLGIDIYRIMPTRNTGKFKFERKFTINVDVPLHKIIADNLAIYLRWDQTIKPKPVNKLDWVAGTVLGIKKVEHSEGFADFYKNHYADYVFYNAIDTILVELLDKKMKTSQVWYMLASELRIDLNSAYSTIMPAETVMQTFIYNQYKVIPKKVSKDVAESDGYTGAFVWPSMPGFFKYVGGLDFASLYPTTMRQFYISPETFMFKDLTYTPKPDEIKTKSGAVYKKDKNAIIPRILTHYFAKRKQAKKDRKIADQAHEDLIKIYEKRTGKKWEAA